MDDFLTGLVLGLHLVSAHIDPAPNQSNVNPGIYAIHSESGITGGIYRNTWRRWSLYAGKTMPVVGPLDLTLGVVSGYQRKLVETGYYCDRRDDRCYVSQYQGYAKGWLSPLVAASVRVELGYGTRARVMVTRDVVHLAIERDLR